MKASIISIGLLCLFMQLSFNKVSAHHHEDLSGNVKYHKHSKTLATIKSGLQILKGELRQLDLEHDWPELQLNSYKNCNISDVQSKLISLVGVSIDFLTSTTEPMEDILDKVNECASGGYAHGLSCLISLRKKCQPDLDQISQFVDEYGPEAKELFSGLEKGVFNCLPF